MILLIQLMSAKQENYQLRRLLLQTNKQTHTFCIDRLQELSTLTKTNKTTFQLN